MLLFQHEPKCARRYFGGGSSASTPAIPPSSPPVTPNQSAVLGAQQNLYRQQKNRKNLSSTIYAGATGGWSAPSTQNAALSGAGPKVTATGGTLKTG